jgi:hypothetical protein
LRMDGLSDQVDVSQGCEAYLSDRDGELVLCTKVLLYSRN